MLARTADNLFWMARYMERAEYVARLLEVAMRMSLLPDAGHGHRSEWRSILVSTGLEAAFEARHDTLDRGNLLRFMVLDPDNPSSILSCVRTARNNGRAVRTALTKEMWESLNATWIELRWLDRERLEAAHALDFLDWVKERSASFRGATFGTALRNDGYSFIQLGAFLERADNTARILDVKYHVLLPEHETVGGGIDHYQWTTILRSVSALRAYHWVYRDRYRPWNIADLLILRPEMPRSLRFCYDRLGEHLSSLAELYGQTNACHEMTGETGSRLRGRRIEQIFQAGLHEFLADFRDRNNRLSAEISESFLIAG